MGEESSSFPAHKIPTPHALRCPGESEHTVEMVTPFSWASWAAGVQQPHSHQLGWWVMPQASRRALQGTCARFCEQMGFAHLWSIQLSPEAHGQAHKPEDVT